jgi:hypothetical protein
MFIQGIFYFHNCTSSCPWDTQICCFSPFSALFLAGGFKMKQIEEVKFLRENNVVENFRAKKSHKVFLHYIKDFHQIFSTILPILRFFFAPSAHN